MATNIAGLFSNPNDIRAERLNELAQQRQAISNMGGSMSDLLGQVAAGGGATGAMMAEGLGGMFGLKTREEQKAAQLNDMASNFDLNTSTGLASFAKQLNDMGMTKEAIMVMDKYQSVLGAERAEQDRQERIAKGDTRTMTKPVMLQEPVWNTKKTEVVGYKPVVKNVSWTQTWNPKTKTWEPAEPPTGNSTGNGTSGMVSTTSGNARAAQGTTVARPVPPPDPKQMEIDQKPMDPWDEFSRNGMM
jgi:hypothetical protein